MVTNLGGFNSFRSFGLFFPLLLVLFSLSGLQPCHAEWVLAPETHHQLYNAWGLFIDEQSTLVNYGQARVWVAMGGTVAAYGSEDSPHHPQIVIHASANAALTYNDNFKIWTQTMDARLGLAFEFEITPTLRFSVGYTHFSGHSADGIYPLDSDLIDPSIGQEFIPVRIVYDIDRTFRLGTTLKPVARSFPSIPYPLWADQFFEFFPWGGKDDPHHFSPYVALGLEEWGVASYTVTYHVQVGAYLGNHFSPGHRQTTRLVMGYYSGADPRLKYFELRGTTQTFGYIGAMFDL